MNQRQVQVGGADQGPASPHAATRSQCLHQARHRPQVAWQRWGGGSDWDPHPTPPHRRPTQVGRILAWSPAAQGMPRQVTRACVGR